MRRLPLLAFLLYTVAASAQVPRTISFQGVVEDNGVPITAPFAPTFRIYDAATGGTLLWTESPAVAPNADGVFVVDLGAETPIDLAFTEPLWLEVVLGTTAQSPRTPLAAAPYALGVYGVRVTPPALSTDAPSIEAGHVDNAASGVGAVVSGGGTRALTNGATGEYATVGGGRGNLVAGTDATVGGGRFNAASATNAAIGGGRSNGAEGQHATVAGGLSNFAAGTATTIGGGEDNAASDSWATVGGGNDNTASGNGSTVGGGAGNAAEGPGATVAGGSGNFAVGGNATVGGGANNRAVGDYTTVAGGLGNHARVDRSFAAGFYARAAHSGSFVWSDGSRDLTDSLVTSGDNQFLVRADGGVGIGTNKPAAQVHVDYASSSARPHLLLDEGTTTGFARLGFQNGNASRYTWTVASGGSDGGTFNFFTRGRNVVLFKADADDGGTDPDLIRTSANGASLTQGGVWTNASSRAFKTDFLPVDPEAVLASLATVPITRWRYRAEAGDVWHLGPVSQDFHAAFGLGATDEAIGTVDADGVALAAAQALAARTDVQQARIDALLARLDAALGHVETLEDRVAHLEAILAGTAER